MCEHTVEHAYIGERIEPNHTYDTVVLRTKLPRGETFHLLYRPMCGVSAEHNAQAV